MSFFNISESGISEEEVWIAVSLSLADYHPGCDREIADKVKVGGVWTREQCSALPECRSELLNSFYVDIHPIGIS